MDVGLDMNTVFPLFFYWVSQFRPVLAWAIGGAAALALLGLVLGTATKS